MEDHGQLWPTPVLENEVLTARIRKMKKADVWECGMFFLLKPVADEEDEEAEPYFPLIMLCVEQSGGMVVHSTMGPEEEPEIFLREFAENVLAGKSCPSKILAGDDRTFALLKDFCGRVGIRLVRKDGLEEFEEAKASLIRRFESPEEWEEENSFPEEADAEELDQFLNTLMQMRDEELQTMPRDLVRILYHMAEWGAVPEELLNRIRRLFE